MLGYLRRARLALQAVVLAVILSTIPATIQANSTPTQSVPGSGGLIVPVITTDVRIDRETLLFDFSSSASSPLVEARYDLSNVAQKDVAVDAVFIAPGGRDLQLSLNDAPLETLDAADFKLPPEWVASKRGLDPRTGEEYDLGTYVASFTRAKAWSFRLLLPVGGKAVLKASYQAEMGYDRGRADYLLRHLVYVLGPAKNWAGFGSLEVTVVVPDKYSMASSPTITKLGDAGGNVRYGATFNGIPADLLRISTMHVPSPYLPWREAAMFVVPLLVAIAVGGLSGKLISRVRRWWLALILAGASATTAGVVFASVATFIVISIEPFASAADDHVGSDEMLLVFWMAMFAPMLSGLIAAVWVAIASIRRSRSGIVA